MILHIFSLLLLGAPAHADSAAANAAAVSETSWYRSLPSFTAIRQAALSVPSLKAAGISSLFARQPSLDDLWLRADQAYHAGHYWEIRRIYFKIVDLDPTDINGVNGLAYSLAMMKHSDADAAIGKDLVVTFAESDFQDLGGIKNKALLAIATDKTLDGFAKGRAVYDWAEPKNADDPEFFVENGIHLAIEQGNYLILNKLPGGLELTHQGCDKFGIAADLWRGRSDPGSKALLARVLLIRGNLLMSLVRKGWDPAGAAADQAQAVKDYREILTLPDVPQNVNVTILGNEAAAAPIMAHSKSSAQKHLKEIGL